MLSVCQAACISSATPREENPLRLLLSPFCKRGWGRGGAACPAEGLQLGRGVRGDGGCWHRWESPEEEVLPRKLLHGWVCEMGLWLTLLVPKLYKAFQQIIFET